MEHGIEHRFGQSFGEGVLLTRVERTDQRRTTVDRDFDAMAELGPRANTASSIGSVSRLVKVFC